MNGVLQIRLHIKILTRPRPTHPTIAAMVNAMREVYSSVGFQIEKVSEEMLNLPGLSDLHVGSCDITPTAEQRQLFNHRNNVSANEIVAYFVRTTGPYAGCSVHPSGRPAVAVSSFAISEWTLAHEVGHLFGLEHVDNNNRLMTGNGTFRITNPPPDLIHGEVVKIRESRLTLPL